MTCQLYRHFAADGTLLYVGIPVNSLARLRGHKKNARWFQDIALVKIETCQDRDEAMRREREAIQTEKPLWNIALRKPKYFGPKRPRGRPKKITVEAPLPNSKYFFRGPPKSNRRS